MINVDSHVHSRPSRRAGIGGLAKRERGTKVFGQLQMGDKDR